MDTILGHNDNVILFSVKMNRQVNAMMFNDHALPALLEGFYRIRPFSSSSLIRA